MFNKPTTMLELQANLESLGFKDTKINYNFVKVFSKDRKKDLSFLEKSFKDAKIVDCSNCSIGRLLVGKFKILVKPIRSLSGVPAGEPNELFLMNKINFNASIDRPLTIEFKDSHKNKIFKNIIRAEHMAHDCAGGSNIKGDVALIDTNDTRFSISVKMKDASFWGSIDGSYGHAATKKLNAFLKKNPGILIERADTHGNKVIYQLTKGLYYNPSDEEKMSLAFGKDNAIVVRETFSDESFESTDGHLKISTKHLSLDLDDLNDQGVYFLIRNDKTRNHSGKWLRPGLRLVASIEKRLGKAISID